MTTDVLDSPAAADEAPARFRPSRALRGLLVAVTAGALVVALSTLGVWAWGPGRSTDAWAGRFGDPRITLAAGASLPAGPETITHWARTFTTYGLPDDTSVLAAAFGGPVAAVGDRTWATASGTVEFTGLADALSVFGAKLNWGARFTGPTTAQLATAKVFGTLEAQTAEVRRVLRVLGWPADAELVVGEADGLGREFAARPLVPEGEQPAEPARSTDRFSFAEDGTLASVTFWTWTPAAEPDAAPIRSASQALDDLRHHRADAWVPASRVPNLVERVVGVRLFDRDDDRPAPADRITTVTLYGDGPGPNDQTNPYWEFEDASGAVAGRVLAVAGQDFESEP